MWRTSTGDRILKGAEAELFQAALREFCDNLTDCHATDEEYDVGLQGFDSLTYVQKLAVLLTASESLLDSEKPTPKLTAVLECAAAASRQ